MRGFGNWEPPAPDIDSPAGSDTSRVLRINGVIAEESWFDDDITPACSPPSWRQVPVM